MRVRVHVRPGSSRTQVGGIHDDALVVAVTARAVEGKATEAVMRAIADALGVPRREVGLVSGATSRRKVVEVPDHTADQVVALRTSGENLHA